MDSQTVETQKTGRQLASSVGESVSVRISSDRNDNNNRNCSGCEGFPVISYLTGMPGKSGGGQCGILFQREITAFVTILTNGQIRIFAFLNQTNENCRNHYRKGHHEGGIL